MPAVNRSVTPSEFARALWVIELVSGNEGALSKGDRGVRPWGAAA